MTTESAESKNSNIDTNNTPKRKKSNSDNHKTNRENNFKK